MIVKDRTAVITGAGSGIGRSLAIAAAARGMTVALIDSDRSALEMTSVRLPARATPLLLTADIRDPDAVAAAAQACAERFDDIACLFANAGVLRAGSLTEQPAADWRLMVDVNITGTIATVTAFLPTLIARSRPARIMITGSQSSFVARPDVCVYSATKHALWAFAEGLKFELDRGSAPIGVSFVAPGGVATSIAGPPATDESATQAGLRQALKEYGASPDMLAEQMLAAIEGDRFWVLPNPETKLQLKDRVQRVLEESDPRP